MTLLNWEEKARFLAGQLVDLMTEARAGLDVESCFHGTFLGDVGKAVAEGEESMRFGDCPDEVRAESVRRVFELLDSKLVRTNE